MMDSNVPRIEPQTDFRRLRCRRCAEYSCLAYSILDSQRGKTVRLYRCATCEEHMWDDDVKPI